MMLTGWKGTGGVPCLWALTGVAQRLVLSLATGEE